MKKWNLLHEVATPDGSKLALVEHDGEYLLRVNGRELMSTHRHASELRLGTLGCEGLPPRARADDAPRVLIGGLGLGFTLRAALSVLPSDAEVIVAELLPDVVAWNRDASYPLAHRELADPRVEVVVDDVYEVLRRRAPFDAIMLDADNGTTAMTTAGNRALYEATGLAEVHAALVPGGRVVYWSAGRERRFETLMQRSGFRVSLELVRAWGTGGPRHALMLGVKASSRGAR